MPCRYHYYAVTVLLCADFTVLLSDAIRRLACVLLYADFTVCVLLYADLPVCCYTQTLPVLLSDAIRRLSCVMFADFGRHNQGLDSCRAPA